MRYIKSIEYIIPSYDKTLTANQSTQIIIKKNMEIGIELSNQGR